MEMYHSFEKIVNNNDFKISLNCYHDLCLFAQWIHESLTSASPITHYHKLNIWLDEYWGKTYKNLHKYGFVNGVGCSCENYDCKLWWEISGFDPIHSPHLKTNVARHHASALERANAVLIEIEQLCEHFQNKQFE
jgi:hypothetical protein